MGFSDKLRAWLRGDSGRRTGGAGTDDASRDATRQLEEFARSRIGVEAFLEPKTAIYSTTVLLVADDGEYLRRPVKDRDAARDFAKRINIPIYDARQVGYPKRMRDYDQGKRPRRVELSELPPWPGDDSQTTGDADGPPPPPKPGGEPAAPAEGEAGPGVEDHEESDPGVEGDDEPGRGGR
ncbi:MAG: hypothetical protein JJT89_16820 [Nitriliruptoraceae bacterium]|nr:hypothetical protein [Nitriliruptoraceae bacterium]